jgi:hypothetical protein
MTKRKPTQRRQRRKAAPTQPSPEFAAILQELGCLSGKLDLAAAHWIPEQICTEDVGAVSIVNDVARALDKLYCALSEFGRSHGHLVYGPLFASFQEGLELLEKLNDRPVVTRVQS